HCYVSDPVDSEPDRPPLQTQSRKWKRCNVVDEHDRAKPHNKVRMISNTQPPRNRSCEKDDAPRQHHTNYHHYSKGGIEYPFWIGIGFRRVPEEGRLHAERIHNIHEGHERHQISKLPELLRVEAEQSMDREKQEIEKTRDDVS